MAAAMPYDENAHCCSKHRRQRELAEADGGVFSRCTVDSPDDWKCVDVEVSALTAAVLAVSRRWIASTARQLAHTDSHNCALRRYFVACQTAAVKSACTLDA